MERASAVGADLVFAVDPKGQHCQGRGGTTQTAAEPQNHNNGDLLRHLEDEDRVVTQKPQKRASKVGVRALPIWMDTTGIVLSGCMYSRVKP